MASTVCEGILLPLLTPFGRTGESCPLFLYDNSLYTGIHMTPERVKRYVDAIPSYPVILIRLSSIIYPGQEKIQLRSG